MSKSPILLHYLILWVTLGSSLYNRYVLAFFMLVYSIYCIVMSLLLFSPSIDKPCTMSSVPPPRLVYKLFAGGKVI